MNPLEEIKNRRSIRKFREKPVEEDKIEKLLDAANWAPSAGNMQARDIIIVKEKETKEKIADAAYSQDHVIQAPVVFVFCANRERSSRRYGSRGAELYCIQDATASVQNLLLESHALGLGSCWVGAFDEQKVREILDIPDFARPVAIVPVGYPAEEPPSPPRRMHLHKEKW